MDDFSENVFSYCVGAFALCSTLASIYRFYRSLLPAQKVVALNNILTEIKDIYDKADAQNLFPSEAQRQHSKSRLTDLEILTNELREKAYSATTPLQEFLSLVRGLSETIAEATCMAKEMRGNLMSLTEEERRRQLLRRGVIHPPPSMSTTSSQQEVGSTAEASEPLQIQQHLEATVAPAPQSIAPPVIDSLPPSRCSTLVNVDERDTETREGKPCKEITGSFVTKLSQLLASCGWQSHRTPTNGPLTEEPVSSYPDTIPPV